MNNTKTVYGNTTEGRFCSILDDYMDGMNFASFSYNDPNGLKDNVNFSQSNYPAVQNGGYQNFSQYQDFSGVQAGPGNFTGIAPADKQNSPTAQNLAVAGANVTGGDGPAQSRSGGPLNNYSKDFISRSNTVPASSLR